VVWLPNAYPRAFYYLGCLHIEAGDLDGALHYLDQGLLLEPASAKLKCEKAQALIRAHRQQDALELYTEVLGTPGFLADADRALALRGRGFVLIERRDLDSAEAAFRESQRYDPSSVMARNELEYIAQLRRRSAQAAQGPLSIARQLGISQDLFDIWYRRYTAALETGERSSDWNTDIDDLARQVGALTEQEISRGRTDLHQAVLNRVKLRIAMSRRNID
jgi:tetratricopeptide (TPR) repeat protein